MKVLLIGYGDLACRLTPGLLADGWALSALRRSPCEVAGVRMFTGDCRDPRLLAEALADQDAVVVTLTPDGFSERDYSETYVAGARALAEGIAAAARRPGRVLWASSTSVYGQDGGEWVDEDSPAQPQGFSGRCLLAAEALIGDLPVPATVVRFSGIYGPGRNHLLTAVKSGRGVPPEPAKWTNRIHSDDCAAVLRHLLERSRADIPLAPLYIGTDCLPVPLHDVQQWLAARMGVPFGGGDERGASRGNRRCSNARLLATGYRFQYPTYREGYGAQLRGEQVDG